MEIINFRDFDIEPIKGKNPEKVLREVSNILSGMGLKYWIACGTLLGLHRDKDFIKYDTDIDFEILVNGDDLPKLKDVGEIIRVGRKNKQIFQVVYMRDNIIIDFYFYRMNGTKIKSHSELFGEVGYPKDFLNHMTKIEFNGNKYPCFEPEIYLPYMYGDNWKIPIQGEKGSWIKDKLSA